MKNLFPFSLIFKLNFLLVKSQLVFSEQKLSFVCKKYIQIPNFVSVKKFIFCEN
jgi:hypothetical protein